MSDLPQVSLPDSYRSLITALDAAGWAHAAARYAPHWPDQPRRLLVELQASTDTGHRVMAWWTSDQHGDTWSPCRDDGARAGLGMELADVTIAAAEVYVLAHPVITP